MQEFVRLYDRLNLERLPGEEPVVLDFNIRDNAGFTPLHFAVLMVRDVACLDSWGRRWWRWWWLYRRGARLV